MGNRVALWLTNEYFKPIVIISALLLLFGFTFIPLHGVTKDGAFIISSAFPIIAGWLLGLRLGMLFWFLHSMLLMILANAVGSSFQEFLSTGIFSLTITMIITCGVGRISDLTKKIQRELKERKRIELELKQYKETLEQQVLARSKELLKSNELLKHEVMLNEKNNEEKLNLQASLKRAEKMEAIGILAGSVAHDLNNILSGIMSYPELILLDLPDNSPLRKPLLTIQKCGQRAASVVEDLLTLVRNGNIVFEVTNLNNIINDFLKSPEFKKIESEYPGITIQTHLQPDLFRMYGSSVHLMKVIMNLVFNSMEAMTKGGRLVISTANVFFSEPVGNYEVIEEGAYVTIGISDTGHGISKTNLDRIFEPFYTKKVMGRSGTGLGLAIVWGTVKDHGGYIDVQSNEGEGTVFNLYFKATDHEVLNLPSNLQLSDYSGSGESVLIIDDEKLQRDICTNILKKLGYAVQSLPSGEEAISYLESNSFDLIIIDMIMIGGIDGFETYKKIIDTHPDQKAIIVSGFSESGRVKNTQALGAGRYIKKPYTIEKLGMAVKNELCGNKDTMQG